MGFGIQNDRQVPGGMTKMNEWNEYTVIARGGACMHILNGEWTAVAQYPGQEATECRSIPMRSAIRSPRPRS